MGKGRIVIPYNDVENSLGFRDIYDFLYSLGINEITGSQLSDRDIARRLFIVVGESDYFEDLDYIADYIVRREDSVLKVIRVETSVTKKMSQEYLNALLLLDAEIKQLVLHAEALEKMRELRSFDISNMDTRKVCDPALSDDGFNTIFDILIGETEALLKAKKDQLENS